MQTIPTNTGKIIRSLRRLKGHSQLQVAKGLRITQQAYSKIEKQKSIESGKLERILAVLKSSRKEMDMIRKITGELSYTLLLYILM